MKKKIFGLVFIIVIIALSVGGYMVFKKLITPKKVHYHAGFVVFKDDKKIDFSDFKYMRVKPCNNKKEHDDTDSDIQSEKAHLHDLVGDVVHIERDGAYWRDLFSNIHFTVNYSEATAYLNGKEASGFQNQKIQPDDSLVLLIGDNKSNHLQDAVKKDYIEKKGEVSVDCGD